MLNYSITYISLHFNIHNLYLNNLKTQSLKSDEFCFVLCRLPGNGATHRVNLIKIQSRLSSSDLTLLFFVITLLEDDLDSVVII